jgi:hypothetical protein
MKKLISKASLFASGLYLTTFSSALTATATPAPADPYNVQMLDTTVTAKGLVIAIINWVLAFAGAVAVLFIIYAGVQYLTSAGNDKRTEAAKKTLTYAVIGLIVIILAKVIVTFVTTGVTQIIAPTPVKK